MTNSELGSLARGLLYHGSVGFISRSYSDKNPKVHMSPKTGLFDYSLITNSHYMNYYSSFSLLSIVIYFSSKSENVILWN